MRVIVAIIALFVIVFLNLFALEGSPKIPFVHDYHKVMTAEKPLMRNNETAKEYRSFRCFFHEKKMHNTYADASARKTHFTGNGSLLTEKCLREWNDSRMGIRAAWYVNLDKQSQLSLKRNISHSNQLMGEWLFINPKTGAFSTKVVFCTENFF
jgi:peptidoglycan-N-acetylglucosamine deacetylase